MNDDLVFALDPGSICSGWAVMDRGERLIEAGVLTPGKAGLASQIRIARMCEDLLQLLAEWEPGMVVIEWTSGKVVRSRHKGKGSRPCSAWRSHGGPVAGGRGLAACSTSRAAKRNTNPSHN